MKFHLFALPLYVLLIFSSCAPDPRADNLPAGIRPITQGSPTTRSDGTLGAGDVIKMVFPGAPEYNQTQKIRANNRVSLPIIGDVIAGGRQLKEFQNHISRRYTAHLRNPNVIVTLEQTSSAVYVSGYVNKPSKVTLDRPMTALEAIMECGGFHKFASLKRVSVVRSQGGTYRRYRLDMDAALKGLAEPFQLQANDVIHVR